MTVSARRPSEKCCGEERKAMRQAWAISNVRSEEASGNEENEGKRQWAMKICVKARKEKIFS